MSALTRDDLPTLERPMTASSGILGAGHCSSAVLLFTNLALLTRVWPGGLAGAAPGFGSGYSQGRAQHAAVMESASMHVPAQSWCSDRCRSHLTVAVAMESLVPCSRRHLHAYGQAAQLYS